MTRRLYQEDSYRCDFEARVAAIDRRAGSLAVELDRTLFYPESGGQPSDTGSIEATKIERVIEDEGRILHITAVKPPFDVGTTVRARIDWLARFINMQQHTGQHILSQAFIKALDARTISSKLGTEHSTVDVSRLGLTWEDVETVERLANSVVYENRAVKIYEARLSEVMDLRIKKASSRDTIRVVEIEGFDKSPCGGTHTRMTGEVGIIKVLRWERIRDTTRVEFICGGLARADYFWKSRFVVDLAQDLTTKDRNIPGKISNLFGDHKRLLKEVASLKREIIRYEVGELLTQASKHEGVRMVVTYFEDRTAEDIKEMAAQLSAEPGVAAMLASGKDGLHFVFARAPDVSVDMREVFQAACRVVGGKGGGRPEVCQGGGGDVGGVGEALKASEEMLKALLAGTA